MEEKGLEILVFSAFEAMLKDGGVYEPRERP
jgi:hypothetical protein